MRQETPPTKEQLIEAGKQAIRNHIKAKQSAIATYRATAQLRRLHHDEYLALRCKAKNEMSNYDKFPLFFGNDDTLIRLGERRLRQLERARKYRRRRKEMRANKKLS